jgi:hypothetical protein
MMIERRGLGETFFEPGGGPGITAGDLFSTGANFTAFAWLGLSFAAVAWYLTVSPHAKARRKRVDSAKRRLKEARRLF